MRRLLSVLVTLLFLAACGGGDDALSKEEFIAEGDRLCREFEERTSELEEPETPEELTELLETAVTFTREFRDDVAALDPPSGEGEEVHQAFLDAIDETIDRAEASREAAAAGDVEAAGERFMEASEASASANEELAEYGFSDCAEE